ncbi:M36 family metallopeptidase [Rubrivirga sp. IMCC45206]|uniref:M36 family metallopeptidase n=1 Tax=Rubrivirga sp. IMCC45206 TaxID=3391614 RepID=UPI0039902855
MRRLLTLAAALGLAAAVGAQSVPLGPGAEAAAIDHLRATAQAHGLTAADVSDLTVSAGHRSLRSGLSYVYVQQRHGGVDVAEAIATVAVDARGEVVHAAGQFVPRLASPVSRHAAALSAEQALAEAAARVGAADIPTTPRSVAPGAEQRTAFGEARGMAVYARKVYVPLAREGVALAWEAQVPMRGHVWIVRLDAATGAELARLDLVVSEHVAPIARRPARPWAPFVTPDATAATARPGSGAGEDYRVFALPLESPTHSGTPPPGDGRTLESDPFDPTASPLGWHDTDGISGPDHTVTWGNNVRAYDDIADDDTADPGDSPDGTASLTFDFPVDFTMEPGTYTDAAVTNLFYWNNIVHDILYHYGFDEAAGNFQETNYGAGPGGGDYVRAEAQDGGDTNNANMATPPDGSPPRMQMYLWDTPTPDIDGDFDAGVIVHEYVHGLTNRLTGGASEATCLNNAEQMGEGWSDYYALAFTQDAGDLGTDGRGIGTFVLDQPTTGPGIRTHPYSTDTGTNPHTYSDTLVEIAPHGVGSVWAAMLWDVHWALIDLLGYDPDLYDATGGAGNQVALQLVTDGLKLQPCSPGFVDGRDAILAADAALFPDPGFPALGVHHALIWDAFAARGLGWSADQNSSTTNADNLEAFDVPLAPGTVDVDVPPLTFIVPPGGTAGDGILVTNTNGPGDGVAEVTAVVTRTDQPAPLALTGGPDDFGYTFLDSDEPGGPTVGFEDISGTGTPVAFAPTGGFPPTDEGVADVALPFPFDFYGAPQPSVQVSTNGFVAFKPHVLDTFVNSGLPSAALPNGIVAAFWDDLLAGDAGVVYVGLLTDGRFAIQWDDVERFPEGGSSFTFQLIFAPDGSIEIQYETMTGTLTSATVGIENLTGTDGLEVVVDGPYVASAKAVLIVPPIPWVTASPFGVSIPEGGAEAIAVDVAASGLPDGVYTADIQITTNDPVTSELVGVTMEVSGGAATLVTGPRGPRFFGPPADGFTVDDLAAQNLVRGVPGYYPANAHPTLLTEYNTATNRWEVGAGAGDVLPLGKAFRWFMTDIDGIGHPAVSQSVALPFSLATPLPLNTADVRLRLDTSGNRWNHLANPFGEPLDLTGASTWPGGFAILGGLFSYDATLSSWEPSPPSLAPWHDFRFRSRGPRANGKQRYLIIPASAAGPLAGRAAAPAPPPGLTFRLDARAATGRRLGDRMLALRFDPAAGAAYDIEEDVEKLQPPATAYALLGTRAGRALVAIDARPFAPAEIPLALEARGTAAEMTLSWDAGALPTGLSVVLVDLATGAEIDVRARSSYAFRVAPAPALDTVPVNDLADPSAAADRFVLRLGEALADAEAVREVALDAPAPNPSAGGAVVRFTLPEAAATRLVVFDVRGREVAVLADGTLEAGRHEAALPAALAAGVYVVRLTAGEAVRTRRAAVVR